MRWRIERIDVIRPIRWDSVRRNEVGDKASIDNLLAAMAGREIRLGIDATESRQQRAAIVLRDVEYVIHASIETTAKCPPGDPVVKYVEMFRRRAGSGQCFHRPYLGTREFAAEFAWVEKGAGPVPIAESRDLGRMLLDIDFSGESPVPLFFPARLENGSLAVPPPDSPEVRQ